MASPQRLSLQLEEPGDDPLADQVFDILQRALQQPDGEVSLETAAEQITALLPCGRPYSTEVAIFLMTCCEVAEQIPYSHASMIRLVTIIDSCLHSSRFATKDDGGETDATLRYQTLSETLRDWWNSSTPTEDPSKFVNFQTFVARLQQRGLTGGSNLPIWILQDALENTKGQTSEAGSAYVVAAAQWLLLQGDVVYAEVTSGKLKLKRWREWHERLESVAARKADGKGGCVYSQEAVKQAGRAAVAMEAVERQKTG